MVQFSNNDLTYLATLPTDFIAELDANKNYLYVGMGLPGAKTTDSSWQIKKFTIDSDGATPIEGRFADGDCGFNKKWSLRATYNYTIV